MLRHFGFRSGSSNGGFRRDTAAEAAEKFASPISAAYNGCYCSVVARESP
jgi:hypothetical protein